jgi:branched-chain amino acid transport system substrate-binding protein
MDEHAARSHCQTLGGIGMRKSVNGAMRAAVAVFSLAGVLTGLSAVSASASTKKAPILIGFVTDETGPAASTYTDAVDGAEARIDAQNAVGGVNGHKLKLLVEDDQSTPTGNLVANKILVSEGVFGIIEDNSGAFGSARYLNQNGIPVTGAAVDGPEWGQQPNTNMFSVIGIPETPINGYLYTYNSNGAELKALGITKLAQVVFNAPSAINAANSYFAAAESDGISKCLDALVPPDNADFGPTVLQMKNLGCNGVEVISVLSTCIQLATDIRQAEVKAKMICVTGYDQNLLNQPTALAAMQGTFTAAGINVLAKNLTPPVKLFVNRLKRYTTWPGGIPNPELDYAYESADLMIYGLELAGVNPTRTAFISKLRKVSDYTVGGLLTTPVIFNHFGTLGMFAKKQCGPLLEVKGKSYVPFDNGKQICGTLVRGSRA